MSRKIRPFTRRQRARMRKRERIELRAEARAARDESKAYEQSLVVFRKCDPKRTEDLANG